MHHVACIYREVQRGDQEQTWKQWVMSGPRATVIVMRTKSLPILSMGGIHILGPMLHAFGHDSQTSETILWQGDCNAVGAPLSVTVFTTHSIQEPKS